MHDVSLSDPLADQIGPKGRQSLRCALNWGQKDADASQGGVGKATLGGGSQIVVAVSGGGSLTPTT